MEAVVQPSSRESTPSPAAQKALTRDDGSIPLGSLNSGAVLRGRYACARKDRLADRNGRPYLALELRDRTGSISARVFRDPDLAATKFERGDAVTVQGRVETYQGKLSAQIDQLELVDQADLDPAQFLPSAYRSVEELEGFLEHLIREVHDPALRGLVESVWGDSTLGPELRRAPCSRGSHHAYLGGLIEHTVAVGTLVMETCALHPRLNSDLLMAAALLHDVGKAREFTYGAEFGISEEGRLLGHLAIGAEMISTRSGPIPEQARLALIHAVLVHHGPDGVVGRGRGAGQGFGSPEALALYRLNAVDASIKGALEGGH